MNKIADMHANRDKLINRWKKERQKTRQDVLLIQIGSFYEAFGTDAEKLSKALGVTLWRHTRRPCAMFPAHGAEKSIAKILRAGMTVRVLE